MTASYWQDRLRWLKSKLRQHLKEMHQRRLGYSQYYAHEQDLAISAKFNHRWSQCQTPIKQRLPEENLHQNRLTNMALAARSIDGLILYPQAIFSFWQRVPPPLPKHGFQAGPMLIRGQLTTDVGGGLCQISTTLFGAFLAGNLQILERYNHSVDTYGCDRFFTLGQDAAVVYGYKDLIVRHLHPIPLQIRLQVDSENLTTTASLWGQAPMPVAVILESKIMQAIPAPSAQGISGWQVYTQRSLPPLVSESSPRDPVINYMAADTYQPAP
ncbi:MAG: VanW family protein [Acaryochloris sp. SU_5_25]|nr:VanW family protein [Acaryochloris sp. SU_5_25]NJR53528.1 VanW family protein [Acaryochloris sp. CRU_2_0]